MFNKRVFFINTLNTEMIKLSTPWTQLSIVNTSNNFLKIIQEINANTQIN